MPRTGKLPLALRTASALAVGALTLAVTSACAHATAGTGSASTSASGTSSGTPASSLRLGYFANVTHSTAITEVANGTLAKDLGSIEAGKLADLVVVSGDPFDFSTLADRVEQVWKSGARVV